MNPRSPRVLFAQMPWATVGRPSIAFGILSRVAAELEVPARTRYLSFELYRSMGDGGYDEFANRRELYGLSEHLFAVDLFGAEALDSDEYLRRVSLGLRELGDAQPWAKRFGDDGYLRHLRDEVVPRFLDWALDEVRALRPTVVGFTTTFNQVMSGLALAGRVKRWDPSVQTLFGGASVDGRMGREYHRALPDVVDRVFLGEAEESLRTYLRRQLAGEPVGTIAGVTRVVDGTVEVDGSAKLADLNRSPAPDYDDYFAEVAAANARPGPPVRVESLPFESSRGCWWGQRNHCVFCGINDDLMSFRAKDAERVVAEVAALAQRHHVLDFTATDWIISRRHCDELFRRLSGLGLDLAVFYEVRPMMSKAQVGAMRSAGVVHVQPGIESFSTPLLSLIRKHTTGIRQVQFLRWCAEAGIRPSYNVLAGIPGDRAEWYLEMAGLVPRLTHLPPPGQDVCFVELHRFAPLYERRADFGIDTLAPRLDYAANFPPGLLDPAEVAYFFDHDSQRITPPEEYLGPLSAALTGWLEAYGRRDRPRYEYRLGPGFLRIEDTRGESVRTLTLTGLHHDIVLLCDEATPRRTLLRLLDAGPDAVDGAVDELIAADVLVREDEHLLTLPIGTRFRSTAELRELVSGGPPRPDPAA